MIETVSQTIQQSSKRDLLGQIFSSSNTKIGRMLTNWVSLTKFMISYRS
jgi:hypothetical protein